MDKATLKVLVNGVPEEREFVYAFHTNYGLTNKMLASEPLRFVPILRANEEMIEMPDGSICIKSIKPAR